MELNKPVPLRHKYLQVTPIASWNMEVRGRPGNNRGILGCTRASHLAASGAGERLWLLCPTLLGHVSMQCAECFSRNFICKVQVHKMYPKEKGMFVVVLTQVLLR